MKSLTKKREREILSHLESLSPERRAAAQRVILAAGGPEADFLRHIDAAEQAADPPAEPEASGAPDSMDT